MKTSKANSIIREIRDNYNTIAREWDISRNHPSSVKLKILKPAKRLLDLGCGNGVIIPAALKKTKEYYGLDISRKLINISKKKYSQEIKSGKVELRVGDARKLPYEDNFFDLVISCAVLHHVPGDKNRQAVFNEVYRVLKPGGRIVMINWNLLNEWAEKRFKIKKQLKSADEPGDVLVPWLATSGKELQRYIHIFTPEELKELAQEAGFKRIKITYRNRAGEVTENGEEIICEAVKD